MLLPYGATMVGSHNGYQHSMPKALSLRSLPLMVSPRLKFVFSPPMLVVDLEPRLVPIQKNFFSV